jgi:hypothetical protein
MKRVLVSAVAMVFVIWISIILPGGAIAEAANFWGDRPLAVISASQDRLQLLKQEVLPQLEEVLTPVQLEVLETNISKGDSFRKTFKTLMLTPQQKYQIKDILKTVPQRNAFATLTPAEKKKLFLKKKEEFMPTSEEILDRVKAGKMEQGETISEEVQAKIEQGVKMRDTFMPSAEVIMERLEQKVEAVDEMLESDDA